MKLHTALLSATVGVSTLLAGAIPVAVHAAAPADAPGLGLRAMNGQGRGAAIGRGMKVMRGSPIEGLALRMENANFDASGVAKPAYWDGIVSWMKGDDAKTVAQWLLANRPATPPQDGTRPGPGVMFGQIDWTAAGVTKPANWDAFVAFLGSDDAKKVFEATHQARMGQRFQHLATELESADFQAAGISKPAFWTELLSWLKGGDAAKLAEHLGKQRMLQRASQ